ncbi:GFA family protein [Sphingomonas sinipercae]|uniref:GFA family protein n=1 Tax=Sphingomonas sinipercae TaxID=2714944 RepID=A0A6G7ZLP7_9SPHN|nr:GFA family protein [Sphingomonas sinipercae]QIL01901.1 GFA family protein [Sphingomonas sinipercae]
MTTRTASCRCGQLRLTATGEPVRVSVCHCLECKKRSGSAFAAQARWPADRVTIEGEARSWSYTGDSGNTGTFSFCPTCGAPMFYAVDGEMSGLIAVAVGAFDAPFHAQPLYSVYEGRKQPWVEIVGDGIDHFS